MPKTAEELWVVDGIHIPVHIYREWRQSNRISITRDRVIIRIPTIGSDFRSWAKEWLKDQLQHNEHLKDRFKTKDYKTGDRINTAYKTYVLTIQSEIRKQSKAHLSDDLQTIHIVLQPDLDDRQREKTIRTLISRIISKDLKPRVETRIRELNDSYFKEKIVSVRIKYTKSNWGSCSTNSNINISSRTLLAPLAIQDYIFVHELAHLKEMNHSPRFWSIVAAVMPDYKDREAWLKNYGGQCSF